MGEFNGNKHYNSHMIFGDEAGIHGYFGIYYFPKCKLYRYDGALQPMWENDVRAKRGFLIRDHYTEMDVAKVHIIADNLCEFLTQEGIEHKKISFDKNTREPIENTTLNLTQSASQ